MDPINIAGACCSLGCCVFTLAAIVGGIVFILRRNKGSAEPKPDTAKGTGDKALKKALDDKPPPAPTVAPQPADFPDDEAPTVVAPPPSLPSDEPADPPKKKKPRAGQTIIAFDDDDDDEF